jgi:hypothetical protein
VAAISSGEINLVDGTIQSSDATCQSTSCTTLSHPIRRGSLIKRIPKAARSACASLMAGLISAVVKAPSNADCWSDLLNFGQFVLAKTTRGGYKRNLTKIIQDRVAAWRSDERHSRVEADKRQRSAVPVDSEKYLATVVSMKLEEGNFKAAVRLVCSEDRPAPCSAETLVALTQKHPPAKTDRRPATNPSSSSRLNALQVMDLHVIKAIRSFPAGSAGGPDGITPQHIKDLTMQVPGTSNELISALTDFVNLLLNGELPEYIREIIFGGTLIALQKKTGDIRPIAVGYTLRRLAAKCANVYVIGSTAVTSMAPLQLGVGVAGGAEAAIHATRRYVLNMPDDNVVVKLDFTNAFNSLRRDAMLEAVEREVPELYRFAYAAYTVEPILQYGGDIVRSREGPQQGDPLGPLMFCITLHPLLSRLRSEFKIGFLDDLTTGGHVDVVARDVEVIARDAAALGLQLNEAKCEIISKNAHLTTHKVFAGFIKTPTSEMRLLGAPVLPGDEVTAVLNEKTEDLRRAVSRLTLLQSQDALILLRYSLSIPKLLYTLRTSDCQSNSALVEFDKTLRNGLSAILNVEMSDDQWSQASLPVRDGGLGIRSAVMLAPSAFLASAAGTTDLQDRILPSFITIIPDSSVQVSLSAWQTVSQSTAPIGTAAHVQRNWDTACILKCKSGLLDGARDQLDRARILASQAAHSADWLYALPVSSLGLRLDDEAVRVAIGLRLGAKICEKHDCPCGAAIDARGTHCLSCRKSAGRHQRHSELNDIIWRAMIKAKIQAAKEPLGLTRTDGRRPDGVTMVPWSHGRCLAWDVTVPDTLAASHIDRTSILSGAAAEQAAIKKTTKYADIVHNYQFVPVAVETMGVWSDNALNFIYQLGRRLTNTTGEQLETAYLLQRLSVAIQRGNTICFANCFT